MTFENHIPTLSKYLVQNYFRTKKHQKFKCAYLDKY